MKRYGVPDGIDLHALYAFLADIALYYPPDEGEESYDSNAALAAAARSNLHTLPEWTTPPVEQTNALTWLYRYRIFLGGLLVAAFCVIVTWRAPVATPDA